MIALQFPTGRTDLTTVAIGHEDSATQPSDSEREADVGHEPLPLG